MVIVKPRLLYVVAWIIVGIFFFAVGYLALINSVEKRFLAFLFFMFGSIGSFYGVHAILNRSKFALIISGNGIKINRGNTSKEIYANEIASIKYVSNFSGRRIEIQMKNGKLIPFDCSKWCSQKKKMSLCQNFNLPCA
jgi:hypothetical protein